MFGHHRKQDKTRFADQISFDPETQEAVIRSSICTGEKTAGFLNRTDGRFTEIMLIRTAADEKRFREICGQEHVRTIY